MAVLTRGRRPRRALIVGNGRFAGAVVRRIAELELVDCIIYGSEPHDCNLNADAINYIDHHITIESAPEILRILNQERIKEVLCVGDWPEFGENRQLDERLDDLKNSLDFYGIKIVPLASVIREFVAGKGWITSRRNLIDAKVRYDFALKVAERMRDTLSARSFPETRAAHAYHEHGEIRTRFRSMDKVTTAVCEANIGDRYDIIALARICKRKMEKDGDFLDTPVIGLRTLERITCSSIKILVVDAKYCSIYERSEVVAEANRRGISIIGA